MTVPEVGQITALAGQAIGTRAGRFARSTDRGAHCGLPPRCDQLARRTARMRLPTPEMFSPDTPEMRLPPVCWCLRACHQPGAARPWWSRSVALRRGRVTLARRLAVGSHRRDLTRSPSSRLEASPSLGRQPSHPRRDPRVTVWRSQKVGGRGGEDEAVPAPSTHRGRGRIREMWPSRFSGP